MKIYLTYISVGFLLLMGLFTGNKSFAQADAISTYFEKYVEDTAFTSIYISPRMFQLIANLDKAENEAEMKKTISQLGGLRILAADSVDGQAYYSEIMGVLMKNRYEELMTVQSSDEDLIFLIKDGAAGKIEELLMLVGGKKNFFMLSFVGNIDLKTISQLSESLEIDGMDRLEKLNDR